MKRFLLGLWMLTWSISTQAVDNLRLPDVRSMGLGGNAVTQSPLFNPSLLASMDSKTIHIEYFNRYTMKQLGTASASFYWPNSLLPMGVDIAMFGFDDYRETWVRASVAKSLGEQWTLGLGIHYRFLQSDGLEVPASRLAADFGATYQPVERLLIGLLIINLPSVYIGEKSSENKGINSYLLQIGFQWEFINNLLIVGSLGTDELHTIIANLGVEYKLMDRFFIRSGVQTAPLLPSLGVGYRLMRWQLDVATIYHPVLGISTGVGLAFSF